MNNDNKNFILFAVIAAVILFGSQFLQSHFFPAANPPVTKIEAGQTKVVPNPGADPAADGAAAVRSRNVVLAETPRVRIDTPKLHGSVNLRGARIDDLVLVTYKETIDKNSQPIRLLSPVGSSANYFAEFGWAGGKIIAPNKDTLWASNRADLKPNQPVTLSWKSPQGLIFQIIISVDQNYMFSIVQKVGNAGAIPVSIRSYGIVSRLGITQDADTWTNHIGPIGVFGSGANYDIGYANLTGQEPSFFGKIFGSTAKAGENYFDTTGGWLGFGDKYWLTALVPNQNNAVHSGFPASNGKTYQANYTTKEIELNPGKILTQSAHFFAGAKEVRLTDDYEKSLGIKNFDKAIDWGWFRIVEKPIFYYLDWLFRMVGNFGVAIILLTVTIRGLMFPIAQRQFASMASMRALQPKMKALQERYKDDKPRQQQEIMALYKTEKVNPLAGCLPTFLQIPIFYALYKVLLLTIEMRHQPFVLWIKDLSAHDPLTPLNLFGYLAFTPPAFLAIGVIPILLGISMYFQFKLNPAPMDETQKQVFAIMPWVLMFVMAPFAVGLQVYWITSNVLTILQQKLLYSRHPALKEAVVK
ncbi:membrane protein insertase YidC [Sphingomonas sp. So64.6b]|uniref:membrane protein insertase YidC n=1 Tax=Sphingomonas sp. So64.6b TaxID=2997354 RepID=UPI0015FFA934|nr:membrane protein insertase YidC [Sphingomonas sp. So64.6b]QNA83212.1 membrane protein insertase YidC [Sphingomonas sp. So64.6b]